eukprot:NODE_226_length_13883_cov_0.528729.p12 type:complete len:113 gc:universal NODE_226_length_13883_cov_0.528729:6289-6627(+)
MTSLSIPWLISLISKGVSMQVSLFNKSFAISLYFSSIVRLLACVGWEVMVKDTFCLESMSCISLFFVPCANNVSIASLNVCLKRMSFLLLLYPRHLQIRKCLSATSANTKYS